MSDSIKYSEISWQDFAAYAEKNPFALLPVGALEQHGPHLPFATDVFIAEHMAEKIADKTGILLLPSMQYTPSFSLRKYPGTLRVEDETFAEQLCQVAESLYLHKIRFLYVINAHIGARQACQMAERRLLLIPEALRMVIITLPGLDDALHKYGTSERWHPSFAHADEYETSAMLAIRPDLVRMEKAVKEYPPRSPLLGPVSMGWDEFCQSGVIGDATLATEEKGRAMLDIMVEKALEIIRCHQSSIGFKQGDSE